MSMGRKARWAVAVGLIVLIALLLRWIAAGAAPAGDSYLAGPWFRYGSRVALVALALTAWFWTQALIGSRPLVTRGEIGDGLHVLSAPLHGFLLARPRMANGVLIVSSAFIDLFGLFLICASILGTSLRPFVGLLLVFVYRQVCQAVCALPVPRDMIWRHPGFPSLLVTYGVANDFFISGHTAIAVLGAIEAARIFPLWVGIAAGVVALLEGVVVIVLRAHYTMDVLGAITAAWCAAALAARLCG
jgi:membrane-associated phospholipid phosphatase